MDSSKGQSSSTSIEERLTEVDGISISSTSGPSPSQNVAPKPLTLCMLPPEIHLVIFSRLHYHIDTTCFGLTCKRFWAIRKKLHGHRNGGKIILTCGLAMFLHGWMGDSYCWDSVSEVFLTKKAFEERCEERCRKRDEAIASYGSAYWERLVGGDLVDF